MGHAQDRYLAHQARKRDALATLIRERHSDRLFSDAPVDPGDIDSMVRDAASCASSCDRRAVRAEVVTDRDLKALLSGVLVGGVGWIHRAPVALLLFADRDAYRAPGEIDFMPYLDAGVQVHQLYLSAASLGLTGCYCNPNIRDVNRGHFAAVFGGDLFCGAFAVGRPREGAR